jgi:N-acetyl-anhydromuramyl-L-alanine amidase AmpD
MPRIQANRNAIDDRFSVLGFSVRSESPLFEVGVATDPALFRADHKAARNRRNFFSSRAAGVLRARRGEAVYLLPPDVLANFIGQPKLYFGLATFRDNSKGTPDSVQAPGAGSMYVNLGGLTERGLRRLTSSARVSSYGQANGRDPSLEWGGDAWPQQPASAAPSVRGAAGTAPPAVNGTSLPYDDGFGRFPDPVTASNGTTRATTATPAAAANTAAPGTAPATTQALRQLARRPTARYALGLADDAADDSDAHGIEAPIPDSAEEPRAVAEALDESNPEYPQASRFVPAASRNYHAMTTPRSIDRVVLHITDGGPNINGTIAWFQNPQAQVSAHYVIGQDGEVVQMVRHNDKAWHAHSANSSSIGIEHVANTRGLMPSAAQLCASAALVTWLCEQYGIGADREHILGHSEADPHTSHTGCPNAVWEWDYYMQMVDTRSCIDPAAAIAQIEGRTTSFALGARPLEIPLDPGVGGQSIGIDALQPADIIVSTARHPVSYAIRTGTLSAVSHAMLYVGDGNVIEAVGEGVREVSLEQAIGDALLGVAYRHPSLAASQAAAAVAHARARVGAPYNYAGVAFTGYRLLNPLPARAIEAIAGRLGLPVASAQGVYCSELVFEAFERAGAPLVASRPSESTPQDLVRLSQHLLSYVGHLKGEDVALGISMTLASDAGPMTAGQTPVVRPDRDSTTGRSSPPAPVGALPPPPAPVVQQQALRASSCGAETIEVPSPISGTTLRRVSGNDGGVVSWELDQLEGLKHPDGATPGLAAALVGGETLVLADWPYLEGDDGTRIHMDLEVKWECDGSSLGNIRMRRHTAAAIDDHRLVVTARVADVAARFPSDNPSCAALDVNVEYRFTRPNGSVVVATNALRLFGNGRHNLSGRWHDA